MRCKVLILWVLNTAFALTAFIPVPNASLIQPSAAASAEGCERRMGLAATAAEPLAGQGAVAPMLQSRHDHRQHRQQQNQHEDNLRPPAHRAISVRERPEECEKNR
jgi:hypothetical protein